MMSDNKNYTCPLCGGSIDAATWGCICTKPEGTCACTDEDLHYDPNGDLVCSRCGKVHATGPIPQTGATCAKCGHEVHAEACKHIMGEGSTHWYCGCEPQQAEAGGEEMLLDYEMRLRAKQAGACICPSDLSALYANCPQHGAMFKRIKKALTKRNRGAR